MKHRIPVIIFLFLLSSCAHVEYVEINEAKRAIAHARLSGAHICAKKELMDAEEFIRQSEIYRINGQLEVSRFFAIKAKEMAELAELRCLEGIEEQRAYAEEAFDRLRARFDSISPFLDSEKKDELKKKLDSIGGMLKEKRYLEAIEGIVNFEREMERLRLKNLPNFSLTQSTHILYLLFG